MPFPFVFATDLHGIEIHFQRLFHYIRSRKIKCLVFGGDLCPAGLVYGNFGQMQQSQKEFLQNFFLPRLQELKNDAPDFRCLLIMGNDDLGANLDLLAEAEEHNVLQVIHKKIIAVNDLQFLGYSFVPPTPFLIKDWEKYENSNRIIEPVAISPENGYRSIDVNEKTTIEEDLARFTDEVKSKPTVFVCHCPPYKSNLDYSTTDRYYYEGLKMDRHLGSIAVRNFIESAQPLLSLHGHIHESTSISGKFDDHINDSLCLNGAFHLENVHATEVLLLEVGEKISYEKVYLS
jgi:Icc-related predicted phosphoesterase